MLIPYVSRNPQICARSLCDQHLRKLIVETAQMLSTATYVMNQCTYYIEELPRQTHINHPFNMWARNSFDNFDWLLTLGECLCEEFCYRFEKKHKYNDMLNGKFFYNSYEADILFMDNVLPFNIPQKPKSVEHIHPTTKAFRQYMCDKAKNWATRTDKKQMKMIFTKRRPPNWMSSVSKYIEVK